MNKLKLNKTNKQLTPQLNHHSPQSRRSRPLAQALPTSQRRWNSSSHKQGFTIIEVVLVLAIAGLIFLMVFIALPALQRSQRDAQRKNDLTKIAAQLENYRANNRGRYVSDYQTNTQLEDFIERYLVPPEEFRDPSSGERYTFIKCSGPVGGCYRPAPEVGEIAYNSGAYCDGERWVDIARNNSSFALMIKLENGGYICLSNQ